MMAKKLKRYSERLTKPKSAMAKTGGVKSAGSVTGKMKTDPTTRAAKNSQQSNMVAKPGGGDPVAPSPSPVTTQPMKKVVAPQGGKFTKVAKVEKAKASGKKAPAKLNKPAVKKKVRA